MNDEDSNDKDWHRMMLEETEKLYAEKKNTLENQVRNYNFYRGVGIDNEKLKKHERRKLT
jgi:hypothetical protein